MERAILQGFLDEGLSLEQMAIRLGVHPSTVANWLKKLGLRAVHSERFAPKGEPDRQRVEQLAAAGATLSEMAAELERGISTVRYWIDRWGIERQRRPGRRPHDPATAPTVVDMECGRHGTVPFRLEGRGYYRCMRCRQEHVRDWRRRVKRLLVDESGGQCSLCGYNRCAAALQFHHVDPATKAFALSEEGVARSLARARAEVAKCVLLCANCHAEVEHGVTPL